MSTKTAYWDSETFTKISSSRGLLYEDSGNPIVTYTYDSPILNGYSVTILEDTMTEETHGTKRYEKNRLVTFIARFPRMVLSEFNTHRVFSRNSASSRARSIQSTIRSVMEEPVVPLFTKNQKGMSGDALDRGDFLLAKDLWLESRDRAVEGAMSLLMGRSIQIEDVYQELDAYAKDYSSSRPQLLSVHKQNVNRLLEPFSWHEVLVTSDQWKNFFSLRSNLKYAAPEIYALSYLMERAYADLSLCKVGVHAPFVTYDKRPALESNLEISLPLLLTAASEAAGVSYHDKTRIGAKTGSFALAKSLLQNRHMSPFEHFAYPETVYSDLQESPRKVDLSGNFSDSWVQLRRVLETDLDGAMKIFSVI